MKAGAGTPRSFVAALKNRLRDPEVLAQLEKADAERDVSVHVAVMAEPHLSNVLEGSKTVESRFATRRTPPFERIAPGDIIFLKRVGGPIVGMAIAGDVKNVCLDSVTWPEVHARSRELNVGEEFWRHKRNSRYATLMNITSVYAVEPISIDKRDRRGWAIISERVSQLSLL
jgi:hypothetical protein